MKTLSHLFALALISFCLFSTSCAKSNDSTNGANFSFRLGDSTYVWNGDRNTQAVGAMIKIDTVNYHNRYMLQANDYDSNFLNIYFRLPSLAIGTYVGDLSKSVFMLGGFKGVGYGWYTSSGPSGSLSYDTVTVQITSIHGNLVDGSFYGTMSEYGNRQRVTDGVFRNVRLGY